MNLNSIKSDLYAKERNQIFQYLKDSNCAGASSVNDPKENTLVFVKTVGFYDKLIKNAESKSIKKVFLILEEGLKERKNKSILLIKTSEYAELLFAEYHNSIEYNGCSNVISDASFIHPSAVVGITGLWIRKTPEQKVIKMKHIGNVVIEDNVYVDACTTIHRGTFGSTIIRKNTLLSCHINVGHNCDIGENCFIGPLVGIGGSTKIGNNVNIWQGAMIRNGIQICDNVVIGMGSVVTKDVTISGTYVGSPARLISDNMINV
jgi:serine acetyltransferase